MEKRNVNIFNLDLKTFNACAWIIVLITYVMPGRLDQSSRKIYGYPFSFLTYSGENGLNSPLQSFGFDILIFLIDILVLYFIIINLKKIKKT